MNIYKFYKRKNKTGGTWGKARCHNSLCEFKFSQYDNVGSNTKQAGDFWTPQATVVCDRIDWIITCLKTLQNMETMIWEKSCVYAPPTFFIMESTKYKTGSLISGRTYKKVEFTKAIFLPLRVRQRRPGLRRGLSFPSHVVYFKD